MNSTVNFYSLLAFTLAALAIFLIGNRSLRAVLFVTLFTAGTIGLALSLAFLRSKELPNLQIRHFEAFGVEQFWVWQTPGYRLLFTAVGALLALAFLALLLEIVDILTIARPKKERLTQFPKNYRNDRSQISSICITVLIPARNEELSLPQTLVSLEAQTRPPEKIIVVADNCSDSTAEIARAMGYQAFETVENTQRKAGALNQVLATILPGMGAHDVILVMDADSQINDHFLATAAENFQKFPDLDAVGGVFFGEPGGGVLGQLQRNEFTRYSDQIKRRGGRVFVLTGTASLFRAQALSIVAKARGIYIPGKNGEVYDTAALTEDNELTIALKTMGSPMISPPECRVTTELMPTWKNLWDQRSRWQRGALENLGAYGFTATTIRYWGQQIAIAYGTLALSSSLLLTFTVFLAQDHWVWYAFWLAIGAIFIFERVWTVRKGGRSAILIALAVVIELAFDIYLQLIFLKVLFDTAAKRRSSWGHVKHLRLASRRVR